MSERPDAGVHDEPNHCGRCDALERNFEAGWTCRRWGSVTVSREMACRLCPLTAARFAEEAGT